MWPGAKCHPVVTGIQGGEKREAEQMIPMGMSEEKTDLFGVIFQEERVAKIANA